jgi:hypothetical protein
MYKILRFLQGESQEKLHRIPRQADRASAYCAHTLCHVQKQLYRMRKLVAIPNIASRWLDGNQEKSSTSMSGKQYENKRGAVLAVHPHGRHEDQYFPASQALQKACTSLNKA